ncbi:MAG: hypothetical protein NVSMB51_09010 [Solirubrobacteraceae bacterium]
MLRRPTRALFAALALVLALALLTGGCGSSKSSNGSSGAASTDTTAAQGQSTGAATTTTPKTRFAKTKFVFHAGLAFGAFHRYIYKPFKAGNLTQGGILKHKKAALKAGLAGLFAYHEIKLALKDAKSSPLLSKLLTPLTALQSKLQALGTRLKRGKADPAAIESANSDVSSISAGSKQAGQPITDQPTPSLGG